MPQHTPFSWVTVLLIAVIAWRVYARLRRSIGRQRFVATRSWLSVTLLPLLLLSVGWGLRFQPPALGMSLAAGIVLGAALGLLGLRLTRFEVAADGLYYLPSAHLGIALSTLLVARLAYRYVIIGAAASGPAATAAMHLTPLTLVLLGTVMGYYVTYAAGPLRWSRSRRRVPSPAAFNSHTGELQ